MAHGLSGFLASVYPDRVRSWVDDEHRHIQLAFELRASGRRPAGLPNFKHLLVEC
jgi:hypothetical protein